ncbi:MAG: hypothetical protein FD143_16 [Ignavibacteria bacterium]|nr:MAG: hypothetical protein FD143_16 [Ignavibacteria bacterium]KAF0158327.1 MAG: hypothetical protein FD188_2585 [Ignavibacteria bacterium]
MSKCKTREVKTKTYTASVTNNCKHTAEDIAGN